MRECFDMHRCNIQLSTPSLNDAGSSAKPARSRIYFSFVGPKGFVNIPAILCSVSTYFRIISVKWYFVSICFVLWLNLSLIIIFMQLWLSMKTILSASFWFKNKLRSRLIHIASLQVSERAMYSDSVEDNETISWWRLRGTRYCILRNNSFRFQVFFEFFIQIFSSSVLSKNLGFQSQLCLRFFYELNRFFR